MNTTQTTLTIGRMTYTVESAETGTSEGRTYMLRGKRGAVYGTMRNANRPELLFVVNFGMGGSPRVFDGVWLTDADGTLRVRGAA